MIQRLFSTRNLSNSHDNGTSTALSADDTQTRDESLDTSQEEFEKARFDYCWLVYESEIKRQQQIETKIQFYLSLVTLFLGVLVFNLNAISVLGALVSDDKTPIISKILVVGGMLVLALLLLSGLGLILYANKFLKSKGFYAEKLSFQLFNRKSGYLQEEKNVFLYRENARRLAIAVKFQSNNNKKRSGYVSYVHIILLFALIMLAVVLGVFVYHSVF